MQAVYLTHFLPTPPLLGRILLPLGGGGITLGGGACICVVGGGGMMWLGAGCWNSC